MAVKTVQLQSGGTLVIVMEQVNILSATEADRALLEAMAGAVRKFERQQQAEASGNGGTKDTGTE